MTHEWFLVLCLHTVEGWGVKLNKQIKLDEDFCSEVHKNTHIGGAETQVVSMVIKSRGFPWHDNIMR